MVQSIVETGFKSYRIRQLRNTSKAIVSLQGLGVVSSAFVWLRKSGVIRKGMEGLVGYRRIFSDLAEAERAARPFLGPRPVANEYAELHMDLSASARPSDYPVLFHLNKILNLKPETRVFDLGGCVGNLFYSYANYLDHPERLNWIVNDLPDLLAEGERIALRRTESRLKFSAGLEGLANCDVLLVSGSLHYFPEPLRAMLERYSARPQHIFINRTPLTNARECATVQDANGFLMPCRLWNRRELIADLKGLGYEKVDEWKVSDLSLKIPFYPDFSISEYTGLYLRRNPRGGEDLRTRENGCPSGIEPSLTRAVTILGAG